MIRDGRETFLSLVAAEALGAEIGDELPISFWTPSHEAPGVGTAHDEIVGVARHDELRAWSASACSPRRCSPRAVPAASAPW